MYFDSLLWKNKRLETSSVAKTRAIETIGRSFDNVTSSQGCTPFMKIHRFSFARKRESIHGSSFNHAVKKIIMQFKLNIKYLLASRIHVHSGF